MLFLSAAAPVEPSEIGDWSRTLSGVKDDCQFMLCGRSCSRVLRVDAYAETSSGGQVVRGPVEAGLRGTLAGD